MTSSQNDGVLAYMAYSIIESRRHELAQDIALSLLRKQGSVTADQVRVVLDAEWVEPSAQELADLVAHKAEASVAYHNREVEAAIEAAERLSGKAEKLNEHVVAAKSAADEAQSEVEAAQDRREQAEDIAAAAVAAGGVAARAPQGTDAASAAAVAGVVSEVTGDN